MDLYPTLTLTLSRSNTDANPNPNPNPKDHHNLAKYKILISQNNLKKTLVTFCRQTHDLPESTKEFGLR